AIERDHAAKGGNRIAGERSPVCFRQIGVFRRSARIVMLDDDCRWGGKLLDERPSSVEVYEIVIRKFLALDLAGTGKSCTGTACRHIKSRFLMWVFAVTHGLLTLEGILQAEGQALRRCGQMKFAIG